MENKQGKRVKREGKTKERNFKQRNGKEE